MPGGGPPIACRRSGGRTARPDCRSGRPGHRLATAARRIDPAANDCLARRRGRARPASPPAPACCRHQEGRLGARGADRSQAQKPGTLGKLGGLVERNAALRPATASTHLTWVVVSAIIRVTDDNSGCPSSRRHSSSRIPVTSDGFERRPPRQEKPVVRVEIVLDRKGEAGRRTGDRLRRAALPTSPSRPDCSMPGRHGREAHAQGRAAGFGSTPQPLVVASVATRRTNVGQRDEGLGFRSSSASDRPITPQERAVEIVVEHPQLERGYCRPSPAPAQAAGFQQPPARRSPLSPLPYRVPEPVEVREPAEILPFLEWVSQCAPNGERRLAPQSPPHLARSGSRRSSAPYRSGRAQAREGGRRSAGHGVLGRGLVVGVQRGGLLGGGDRALQHRL